MKRLLALIFILILLVGCGAQTDVPQITSESAPQAEIPVSEDAGNGFGSFSATTLTGETITDAIFAEADLTVVNLWGTFCGPCINEMPTLGMLHEELKNVQFLGIVLDCNDQNGDVDSAQVEVALDIVNSTGAAYPTVVLNMELVLLGMANYQYIPTTLFVDGNGNIVGTEHVGALDEAGWRQVIAERLEMIGK